MAIINTDISQHPVTEKQWMKWWPHVQFSLSILDLCYFQDACALFVLPWIICIDNGLFFSLILPHFSFLIYPYCINFSLSALLFLFQPYLFLKNLLIQSQTYLKMILIYISLSSDTGEINTTADHIRCLFSGFTADELEDMNTEFKSPVTNV